MNTTIRALSNLDQLKAYVAEKIEAMGFTHYLYIRANKRWINHKDKIISNYSNSYFDAYKENHYQQHDPVIDYLSNNTDIIFSSEIYDYFKNAPFDVDLTRCCRGILNLNRRYGFHNHMMVCVPSCDKANNVMLIATQKGLESELFLSQFRNHYENLNELCKDIDECTIKKFKYLLSSKGPEHDIGVTRKQRSVMQAMIDNDQCARWVAQNVLSLSHITAQQHLSNAKKALHCKTTLGAILRAVKYGVVNLDQL